MARKKEEEQDHMKIAEKLRSTMVTKKKDKIDARQAFHKFFIKIKEKLNLKPEMEIVLWKHLQSTQKDKPEKFKEGVESFGYKIS
jgi:hypothetical protein